VSIYIYIYIYIRIILWKSFPFLGIRSFSWSRNDTCAYIPHTFLYNQKVLNPRKFLKFFNVFLGAGHAGVLKHGNGGETNALRCAEPDQQTKELFLPFRCFCTRKDVSWLLDLLSIGLISTSCMWNNI